MKLNKAAAAAGLLGALFAPAGFGPKEAEAGGPFLYVPQVHVSGGFSYGGFAYARRHTATVFSACINCAPFGYPVYAPVVVERPYVVVGGSQPAATVSQTQTQAQTQAQTQPPYPTDKLVDLAKEAGAGSVYRKLYEEQKRGEQERERTAPASPGAPPAAAPRASPSSSAPPADRKRLSRHEILGILKEAFDERYPGYIHHQRFGTQAYRKSKSDNDATCYIDFILKEPSGYSAVDVDPSSDCLEKNRRVMDASGFKISYHVLRSEESTGEEAVRKWLEENKVDSRPKREAKVIMKQVK